MVGRNVATALFTTAAVKQKQHTQVDLQVAFYLNRVCISGMQIKLQKPSAQVMTR